MFAVQKPLLYFGLKMTKRSHIFPGFIVVIVIVKLCDYHFHIGYIMLCK